MEVPDETTPQSAIATGEVSKVVGIDLGVSQLATLSTGETIANPNALEKKLKTLRRLSRGLSRKQKGSKNREKSRRKLCALHRSISDLRCDTLHKMTTNISRRFNVVCQEDLNVRGMTKNKHLARRLSDSSIGEIRRQLEYKTTSRGGRVLFVNAFFPSSKLCNICLAKNECLALPCISNSRSGVAFLSPGNLWTCDQMPSSQYQTCVGNAEARYGAAIRRCAQMDAGTPGGGGINNPPPRPPHNPPNYPPPSCQFINGAVYCPAPGQTCSFINGYVYCGYSCQYINGSVYCPAWQQTCNFINGAVYCGVNCQYLNAPCSAPMADGALQPGRRRRRAQAESKLWPRLNAARVFFLINPRVGACATLPDRLFIELPNDFVFCDQGCV